MFLVSGNECLKYVGRWIGIFGKCKYGSVDSQKSNVWWLVLCCMGS